MTGSASCGLCHREYTEWQADAHSQSAINPRFVTMYRGSDVHGQKGQPTQFTSDGKALPPDPALPDYGPGFRLDNPERAGNCATCHTPRGGQDPQRPTPARGRAATPALTVERAETQKIYVQGVTPVGIEGIGLEGITCEFCHKVRRGHPRSQAPVCPRRYARHHVDEAGPAADGDDQLFFGTLIDVARSATATCRCNPKASSAPRVTSACLAAWSAT